MDSSLDKQLGLIYCPLYTHEPQEGKTMRNHLTLAGAIVASLILATTAQAASEDVSITKPQVNITHQRGFFTATTYTIPPGDAAKITYKVYRHRFNGAGFRLVRKVQHVVAAADGFDAATLKTPLFFGVGYRIQTRLVDVVTGTHVSAPVVKIRA